MPVRKTPRSEARRKTRSAAKPPAARAAGRAPRGAAGSASPAPGKRPAAARPPAGAAARQTVPSAIGLVSQHTGFTSHALDDVRRFYTQVLGFASAQGPAGSSFTVRVSPASSIGFAPPVPGPPEQWRPPREPALCFVVRDVDRAHADLVARGVEFTQAPTDTPAGQRVAILKDPEGRTVCLAQTLEK